MDAWFYFLILHVFKIEDLGEAFLIDYNFPQMDLEEFWNRSGGLLPIIKRLMR